MVFKCKLSSHIVIIILLLSIYIWQIIAIISNVITKQQKSGVQSVKYIVLNQVSHEDEPFKKIPSGHKAPSVTPVHLITGVFPIMKSLSESLLDISSEHTLT